MGITHSHVAAEMTPGQQPADGTFQTQPTPSHCRLQSMKIKHGTVAHTHQQGQATSLSNRSLRSAFFRRAEESSAALPRSRISRTARNIRSPTHCSAKRNYSIGSPLQTIVSDGIKTNDGLYSMIID